MDGEYNRRRWVGRDGERDGKDTADASGQMRERGTEYQNELVTVAREIQMFLCAAVSYLSAHKCVLSFEKIGMWDGGVSFLSV